MPCTCAAYTGRWTRCRLKRNHPRTLWSRSMAFLGLYLVGTSVYKGESIVGVKGEHSIARYKQVGNCGDRRRRSRDVLG